MNSEFSKCQRPLPRQTPSVPGGTAERATSRLPCPSRLSPQTCPAGSRRRASLPPGAWVVFLVSLGAAFRDLGQAKPHTARTGGGGPHPRAPGAALAPQTAGGRPRPGSTQLLDSAARGPLGVASQPLASGQSLRGQGKRAEGCPFVCGSSKKEEPEPSLGTTSEEVAQDGGRLPRLLSPPTRCPPSVSPSC